MPQRVSRLIEMILGIDSNFVCVTLLLYKVLRICLITTRYLFALCNFYSIIIAVAMCDDMNYV